VPGYNNPTIRIFRIEDSEPARTLLFDAYDAGELQGWSRDDVQGWWEWLDTDPGATLVDFVDGELRALITARWDQLVVAPAYRRRGVGTALVTAAESLSRDRGEDPVTINPPRNNPVAEAFLRAIGYAYRHSLWHMRLPETTQVQMSPLPTGFWSRPYRDSDLDRYVTLINESFQDHPTPFTITAEVVTRAHNRHSFDPTNVILVTRETTPDVLTGFCAVSPDSEAEHPLPEINVLGVSPGFRGLGIGRWLLNAGIRRARDLDAGDVYLKVESLNERGLSLYTSTGFLKIDEWPRWSRRTATSL
jgi:mycothiol synthase